MIDINETEMLFDHQYEQALKDNEAYDAEMLARFERQKKDEAARLVARKKEIEWQLRHLKAIAAFVPKPNIAKVDEENGKIYIDGVDVTWQMRFNEEYSSSGSRWRSGKATGKVRLTVGDYGNRVSYPQRKDGSYNYEDVAYKLRNYAEKKNSDTAKECLRRANQFTADSLRSELRLHKYDSNFGVSPSSYKNGHVAVEIKISRPLSVAEVKELHAVMLRLKLVEQRS